MKKLVKCHLCKEGIKEYSSSVPLSLTRRTSVVTVHAHETCVAKPAGTITSKVVPTEYDIECRGGMVWVSDDHGRRYGSDTLELAYAHAEASQNPQDPIHQPPYYGRQPVKERA